MALLLRSPVWWTVVSPALGIPEPSLPFVTLSRWMENLEASAILLNICDAGASDSMVMDSGRPLIGRPEGYVSSVLVGGWNSRVSSIRDDRAHIPRGRTTSVMLVEDIALRDGGSVARETFRGWLLWVGLAYLSLGNYVMCLERLDKVLERRLVGLSVFIYLSIRSFLYISTLILYYARVGCHPSSTTTSAAASGPRHATSSLMIPFTDRGSFISPESHETRS
jgi:hypothetical protein